MQLTIARFVNTSVLALLAGLSLTVQCGFLPTFKHLDAPTQLLFMQQMIPPFTMIAKPLMIIGLMSFLVRLIREPGKNTASYYWTVCSFILFLAGGLVTILGNFPINAQIASWNPSHPPLSWPALNEKWNQFNFIRFLTAQGSFIAAMVVLLFIKETSIHIAKSSSIADRSLVA